MHEENVQFGSLRSLLEGVPSLESYHAIVDLLLELEARSGQDTLFTYWLFIMHKLASWPLSILLDEGDSWTSINKSTVYLIYQSFHFAKKDIKNINSDIILFVKDITFRLVYETKPMPAFSMSLMDDLPYDCLIDDEKCLVYFENILSGTDDHKYHYIFDDIDWLFKNYLHLTLAYITGISGKVGHSFPWDQGKPPNYQKNFIKIKTYKQKRLSRELTDEAQMTPLELDLSEAYLGIKIPKSMRDFYLSFGRLQHRASDHVYAPWNLFNDISPDLGFIKISTENQGMADWVVLTEDDADDPRVYMLSHKRTPVKDITHLQLRSYWNSIEDTNLSFSDFMAEGLDIVH